MQIRKKDFEEYENLRREITRILGEHNPIGIADESNPDEYDLEAKTILRKLDRCDSVEDVTKIVFQDFKSWFSPDIAGAKDDYRKISEEIWALWISGKIYRRIRK
ncbi:MAG TPA: hypothetical protein VGB00_08280 [Pyrinomonadaceae bacterium]|jgi:hypothetical protein